MPQPWMRARNVARLVRKFYRSVRRTALGVHVERVRGNGKGAREAADPEAAEADERTCAGRYAKRRDRHTTFVELSQARCRHHFLGNGQRHEYRRARRRHGDHLGQPDRLQGLAGGEIGQLEVFRTAGTGGDAGEGDGFLGERRRQFGFRLRELFGDLQRSIQYRGQCGNEFRVSRHAGDGWVRLRLQQGSRVRGRHCRHGGTPG